MAVEERRKGRAGSPLTALHLVVRLLGEVETADPTSSFYDRLAEAACRLGSMERAVVFLYDDVLRRVRAVGSHGIDLEMFTGLRVTAEDAPLAARALEQDRVVDVDAAGVREQLPAGYVEGLGITAVACIPMSAGGKGYGVVLADMGARAAFTDEEREILWTVGKMSALAYSARLATRQQERAGQLADRLALARDLHERVAQRVFGVSLALDGDAELGPEDRHRCAAELRAAQQDLRDAMQRPLAPLTVDHPDRTLREELDRLQRDHASLGLGVTWQDGAEIPAELEGLAQSVLAEAVRNARKHADPTAIDVIVERDGDAVSVEVLNDGVRAQTHHGAGMGLRLAAFEALHQGGGVDFGPTPPDRWHVRLVLPLGDHD